MWDGYIVSTSMLQILPYIVSPKHLDIDPVTLVQWVLEWDHWVGLIDRSHSLKTVMLTPLQIRFVCS